MNKETFAKYISNPSLLDNDSLPEIKAMLDEFPYFQSAWVLYIKNLHTIKDIRYESKLKTACAYISDRKHLHDILKGIAVKKQDLASQPEENTAIVQPQNIESQQEEIRATEISESSNLQIIESSNSEPEEHETINQETQKPETEYPESSNLQIIESSNSEPEDLETRNQETQKPETEYPESSNLQIIKSSNSEPEELETRNQEIQKPETEEKESSNHQIFESSNPELEEPETRNQEIQKPETEEKESSNHQIFEYSNPEPEEPETRNIETQKPESSNLQIFESSNLEPEEPETRNIETQKLETEPPAFPEPDKPESLADRILRQAEEMRRAKAAAQAEKEKPTESNAETQASQKEDTISQQEEIAEENPIIKTQDLASQREIQDTEIPESSNLQIFESSNSEPEEPETRNQETQKPETEEKESSNLQIFESSNSEPEEPETRNQETQKPETEEKESSNLQIFESSNSEPEEPETRNQETQKPESINAINEAQIRELIEKQLHSLGINANITFSGNSANIQFENIATAEKPEENLPEQTVAKDESTAEIDTKPTIEEQIEKRKNDRNKKANLIDKFIESKARIVPKKDYHSDNKLSTESIIEDEELFTEQLAKIYIKQGHLEKALETYEKLYLKYPEKNIYFATRIEYVKRLMNK